MKIIEYTAGMTMQDLIYAIVTYGHIGLKFSSKAEANAFFGMGVDPEKALRKVMLAPYGGGKPSPEALKAYRSAYGEQRDMPGEVPNCPCEACQEIQDRLSNGKPQVNLATGQALKDMAQRLREMADKIDQHVNDVTVGFEQAIGSARLQGGEAIKALTELSFLGDSDAFVADIRDATLLAHKNVEDAARRALKR